MEILLVYPVNPGLFGELKHTLETFKEKANSLPIGLSGIASLLPSNCLKKIINRKSYKSNEAYRDGELDNPSGTEKSNVSKSINYQINHILNDIILDKYFPETMNCSFVITRDRWKYFDENDKKFLYSASYISVCNSSLKLSGDLAIILKALRRKSGYPDLKKTV